MKRIQSLTDSTPATPFKLPQPNPSTSKTEIPPSIDIAMGRMAAGATCAPQAVFSPMHYESGYAYPLVVWLHGNSDDERQLRRVMPIVSMRNFVAVAPRGTVNCAASEQGATESSGFGWEQSESHIEEAADRVFDSVAFARERFTIAGSKVFLAGYQTGGTMAMRLALHFPNAFAGAVSIGGRFPDGQRPLRYVTALRDTPLLFSMGRSSTHYPETQLCQDLQLAHAAGLSVSVRQYPCGDELTSNMLTDVNAWIMENACGACAS